MRKLNKSIEILASSERVFAFMTVPTNLPNIWPSLVDVRDVEQHPGGAHAFSYTYKMAGIPLHGRSHTTEVEPNRLVVTETDGGVKSTFRWQYTPTPQGTRLSVAVDYSIPAPVIGRIAESVLNKVNEHELEALLANAKAAIESALRSEAASTSTAPPA